MGGPQPLIGFTYNIKPVLIETLFTFALAFVFLQVSTSKKSIGNSYFGLAIGFVFMAAVFAGGRVSGGAFNPAIGIGPLMVDTVLGNGGLSNLWIYIIGPCIGSISAAMVYNLVNKGEE